MIKQIINNKYSKVFCFYSSHEIETFISNQKNTKILSFDESYGDYFYCIIFFHSLTKEKEFILTFSSDEREENLNLLFWNNSFVISTGKSIYVIDEKYNIKSTYQITTQLIGLFLLKLNKLLVLEEAYMRIISWEGKIIKSELFDVISNFSINDDFLFIQTNEDSKIIALNGG